MLETVAENVPMMLWSMDADGNVASVNRACLEFSGRTMATILGQSWTDDIYPDDREGFFTTVGRALARQEPWDTECRVLNKDGEYNWLRHRVRPLFDGAGCFIGFAGSTVNISMRKAVTEQHSAAMALLNAIDSSSPVGMAFFDTNMALVRANPAVVSLASLELPRDIGRRPSEMLGERGVAMERRLREVLSSGRPVKNIEARRERRRHPGQYVYGLMSYHPVTGEDGRIVGVGLSIQDITDLKKSQEALRLSEARFETLTNTMPQIVWTARPDGRLGYVNSRFSEYTGQPAEILLGDGWHANCHPDDRDALSERWAEAVQDESSFEAEFRLRRHDGIYRWHVARALPVRADGGEVAWFGSCTDVNDMRLSQARYRMLADSLPQIVWTATPDGEVNFLSRQWFDYTRRTPAESLGSNWRKAVHADDMAQSIARWRAAVESGNPYDNEFRLHRASDGEYRWHISRAVPIRESSSGEIVAWFGTSTDIHDRKRAETEVSALNRELRLRLADLETLLRVLPIGVGISHDREARDIRMNRALANMVGLQPEDNGSLTAPGLGDEKPFRVLCDGTEQRPEDFVMRRAAASGEENLQSEYTIVRKDGSEVQLLVFAAPLMDEAQPRGSIGAFVDVTGVKHAQAELFAAEARYQAAGEAVPFGVWAAGIDGRVTYVSQSFLDFTGLTLAEVQAGGIREHLRPEQRDAEEQAWRACVAARAPWEIEHEVRGASGEWRTVLSRGRPLYGPHGLLTGYAGINLDISVRKRMEQELARSVVELRKANAVKDELLGLVSHELRTPLTTITGNAQALRRHANVIDEGTRLIALQDIENDAARLQRLIENMLVLARLEGAGDFEPEPVLLQRLLPRTIQELQLRWPDRELTFEIPGDLPPASAQPGYVEQIITNLLANAVKYSTAGAPVEVRVMLRNEMLTVLVEDRGSGLALEDVHQIFLPFYRSRTTASTAAGAGLGLAVCQRLVAVQQGTIWAEPRPGGGASVGFTLPVIPEQAPGDQGTGDPEP